MELYWFQQKNWKNVKITTVLKKGLSLGFTSLGLLRPSLPTSVCVEKKNSYFQTEIKCAATISSGSRGLNFAWNSTTFWETFEINANIHISGKLYIFQCSLWTLNAVITIVLVKFVIKILQKNCLKFLQKNSVLKQAPR